MTKWNQWKESKNKKVSGVWGIKVFLLCRRRGGKLKEGCIFLPGISCSGDLGWYWEGERSGWALFLGPEMLLWWEGGKCRKGLGMLALQLSGPCSAPLQNGASYIIDSRASLDSLPRQMSILEEEFASHQGNLEVKKRYELFP